ncbi:MAG: oligoendopeptidase F [Ignavibacteriae bacterium]|nr:oligoendopeptidase F [Ignavibacteria bacterium]MBI3365321.1 oligoendopeptidase F [Ignavibacteriota bacterium]
MYVSLLVLFAILLSVESGVGQERDRSKIADKYKWNLKDLYPSDDAWQEAKKQFIAGIPKIEQFKGTLNQSAKQLLACLQFDSDLSKIYARLSVYASLNHDQDTRDSKYLAMSQEISQIGSDYAAKSSYIRPEILKMESAAVMSFVQQEKGLEVFRHNLDDILRTKAHTGTEGEEKIIADASLMSDAPGTVFGIFSDADFPYADVTLSDGSTAKLDKPAFNRLRPAPNRDDRKKVFATFFNRLNDYRRTLGTTMNANVKSHMFYAKARSYGSSLERALDANNIPVQVYHSLVDGVNANLPTFHRYLNLRKRILGLDTLHYYDLYAPLVSGLDLKYSVEESEKNILAALKPLGKGYIDVVQKALNERWIDLYPTAGKRAGAYSQGGAYDVHPYMLLNYNAKYDDMSTLAHELGHTMQSYLSNTNQPYPTAEYPIFVAEVASTFNEALLIDYMLKQIKDDKQKLSLLGNYLENIKGTVFRQTQFADFELQMHELAEKGEALTGDRLNDLYMEITKKYYGHDKGVCIIDDEIKSEWAFIPHFYYNFYVYQYATSFTASAALSEKVLAGDQEATKRYLAFLSAGGSKYPIDLLKDAGVDMTTSQPLELTMQKMNRVIDEMEKILDRMKK